MLMRGKPPKLDPGLAGTTSGVILPWISCSKSPAYLLQLTTLKMWL
jgi:hypothetical protein